MGQVGGHGSRNSGKKKPTKGVETWELALKPSLGSSEGTNGPKDRGVGMWVYRSW